MDAQETGKIAIDADGHVIEPGEMFAEYLAPEYRARTQGFVLNADNNRRFIVDGIDHPPFPKEISVRKPMEAENRLKVLDKELIQTAVLFPSAGLVAGYLDAPLAAAVAGAYNDWIADYVAPHKDRMRFAAPVALHDVDRAIDEARRAVRELGAVAVCVRPNPTERRTLDNPAYDPFYAAVEKLGVPLVVHESTGCPDTAGGDRYGGMQRPESYVFHHVISHSFEQMFAAMSILCGGVCERFPTLKFGFFEAGCSWAPYWLARLDDHFGHPKLGRYMKGSKRPSEYFQRQCFVTCDPGDHTLPLAVSGIGADKILFATDYPHFDSGAGAVNEFLAVEGVSSGDQRKILWSNAAQFFGLEVPVAA